MQSHTKKFFYKGQGIVEYILITALVAAVATTVFRVFQSDVEAAYKKAGAALLTGVETGSDGTGGLGEN